MASENGEVSEEESKQLQELLARTQEQLLRAHEQLLQLQMANLQVGGDRDETNGWAGQNGGGKRAIESPSGRGWSVQMPAGGSGGGSRGGLVASPLGWSDSPVASPGFSPGVLRKGAGTRPDEQDTSATGDIARILERQEELRLKLQLLEKKQALEDQLREKQHMLRASQKKQSHPDNCQLRPSVKSQNCPRENGEDRPLWSQNATFAASTGSVMRGMNRAAMRGSTSSISGSRTQRALSRGRGEVRDASPARECRIRFTPSTDNSLPWTDGDGRPGWRQNAAFAASTGSVMRGMNQAAMRGRRDGDVGDF